MQMLVAQHHVCTLNTMSCFYMLLFRLGESFCGEAVILWCEPPQISMKGKHFFWGNFIICYFTTVIFICTYVLLTTQLYILHYSNPSVLKMFFSFLYTYVYICMFHFILILEGVFVNHSSRSKFLVHVAIRDIVTTTTAGQLGI